MGHDHPDRPGALEQVRHLVLAVAGVHPQRGGAQRGERELRHEVLQHVGQPQGHHVTAADPPRGEVGRQTPGCLAQTAERQRAPAPALHQRNPGVVLGDETVEPVSKSSIHPRRPVCPRGAVWHDEQAGST